MGKRTSWVKWAALAVACVLACSQPAGAVSFNWQGPNNGLWSTPGNWNDTLPVAGNVAVFSDTAAAGATVDVDVATTVAGLQFNTQVPGGNTIASAGSFRLTLDGTGSGGPAAITVAGTHAISAPLQLTDDTTSGGATTIGIAAAADSLTLSGPVTTSGVNGTTTTLKKTAAGTLNISGNNVLYYGNTAGTDPDTLKRRVYLLGGVTNITNAKLGSTQMFVADGGGSAYVKQTDSDVVINGWSDGGELRIGGSGGAFGSYAMKNGTQTYLPGAWTQVGNGGYGLFSIDGTAALDYQGSTFEIGDNASPYSAVIQRSGTVKLDGALADDFWGHIDVGVGPATGVYNQLGGTVTDAAGVHLQMNRSDNCVGIYNLGGGTLTTSAVIASGNFGNGATKNAVFNFHGGTLKPTATSTDFIKARNPGTNAVGVQTVVWREGGTIDTTNGDVTINCNIVSPTGSGVINTDTITPGAAYNIYPVDGVVGLSGGTGFKGTPIIKVNRDAGDATGQYATAIANMVDGGAGELKIASIQITNPGINYTAVPTFEIVGGDPSTPAVLPAPTIVANISGGLTKKGPGTLTLAGANTYTGATSIDNGTLALGQNAALPEGTALTLGNGADNGTLDLAGYNPTVGSLAVGGTAAASQIITNSSLASNSILKFKGAGKPASNFGGTIQDVSVPEGMPTTGLDVVDGDLTLSGANTYRGGTLVEGGTLTIAKASALPAGGALTIEAGGTVVLASGLSAAAAAGGSATSANAVPEPGTLALLAAAALGGLWLARRRR